MDELIEQVRILAETQRLTVERMEQAFKLFSEKAEEMSELMKSLVVTDEALTKSLDESDGQIDDLAKITALLTMQYQKMQHQTGEQ